MQFKYWASSPLFNFDDLARTDDLNETTVSL